MDYNQQDAQQVMGQHHSATWTERTKPAAFAEHSELPGNSDLPQIPRQSFKHPNTSLGFAGHIVHMAGVFIPLVAGELVQDAAKYKKTVRLASIGTALAYETLYVMREHKREKEQSAKLAECQSR